MYIQISMLFKGEEMKTYILVLISVSLITLLSVSCGLVTVNIDISTMQFEKLIAIGIFAFIFYIALPMVLYIDNK